jgi:hypothetical protein
MRKRLAAGLVVVAVRSPAAARATLRQIMDSIRFCR